MHSDGQGGTHWHVAITNGQNYYPDGSALPEDPCPGVHGNQGTAGSTSGSSNSTTNNSGKNESNRQYSNSNNISNSNSSTNNNTEVTENNKNTQSKKESNNNNNKKMQKGVTRQIKIEKIINHLKIIQVRTIQNLLTLIKKKKLTIMMI